MANEIDLGGTIYISSKRAAEITGYTQDYVGQLARGGQILAQRISGLWYVVEQSLRDYKTKADEFKPEPPKPIQPMQDVDTTVSFDGKDYVSAQRGATVTGYHQDYVGQLARSGKILSRQIGNRWYVDRVALLEHKKYNDSLLGAVQTESVGLAKDFAQSELKEVKTEEASHFKYIAQDSPSVPVIRDTHKDNSISPIVDDEIRPETVEIPIRVIRSRQVILSRQKTLARSASGNSHKAFWLPSIAIMVILLFLSVALMGSNRALGSAGKLVETTALFAAANLSKISTPNWIRDLSSTKLIYIRGEH